MPKQELIDELKIQLGSLFDMRQELSAVNKRQKELQAAIKEVQGELLEVAKAEGVREIEAGDFHGEVRGREENPVTTDALLEYLEKHKKMHLLPVLTKVLDGRVSQYLGKDVRAALADTKTIDYHSLKVTRKVDFSRK